MIRMRHQLFFKGKKKDILLLEQFVDWKSINKDDLKEPITQMGILDWEEENLINPNIVVKRQGFDTEKEYNKYMKLSRERISKDDLLELLIESRNQLEYLNGKFKETGTTNSLLSRLNTVIENETKNGQD